MSIVKVFFLKRVFEEGIYYVCRGDVFVVTLNVRFHDATKNVFKFAVFTLKFVWVNIEDSHILRMIILVSQPLHLNFVET